jgi:hypothetical protein
MDYHEPHPAPNEKTQPIQWTERPTGALVGANSLWPLIWTLNLVVYLAMQNMKKFLSSFHHQSLDVSKP